MLWVRNTNHDKATNTVLYLIPATPSHHATVCTTGKYWRQTLRPPPPKYCIPYNAFPINSSMLRLVLSLRFASLGLQLNKTTS